MGWCGFVAWNRGGALFLFGSLLCFVACSSLPKGTPPGAVVGRYDAYDYSPSVIRSGNIEKFWWCGRAANPNDTSQETDTILYESINVSTGVKVGPNVVLGETPGAWDSVFTCNPKVIEGEFKNPLGDSLTYGYAMYYVGTASDQGIDNSIGVAFSNDGITWKKYPNPIISYTALTGAGYGPAQPVPYNSDQKSGIWLFYEDSTPPANHHVEATSTDGVHFNTIGTLTTNGLDPNNPNASWGEIGYDQVTNYWYALFNLPGRTLSSTGGSLERGSYGIQLYRIAASSLLSGASPWEPLKTLDTNLTGNEENFLAGFERDGFGNLNVGSYPTLQIFPSISNPKAAWNDSPEDAGSSGNEKNWDIGSGSWDPNASPLLPLKRYFNGQTHEVTTGWIDPNATFVLESTLGSLYEAPRASANVAMYGCKAGSTDYFMSLDAACEGQLILGVNGYGYSNEVADFGLIAIYRCFTGADHFVSTDPKCEGQHTDEMLGYIHH